MGAGARVVRAGIAEAATRGGRCRRRRVPADARTPVPQATCSASGWHRRRPARSQGDRVPCINISIVRGGTFTRVYEEAAGVKENFLGAGTWRGEGRGTGRGDRSHEDP